MLASRLPASQEPGAVAQPDKVRATATQTSSRAVMVIISTQGDCVALAVETVHFFLQGGDLLVHLQDADVHLLDVGAGALSTFGIGYLGVLGNLVRSEEHRSELQSR